MMSINKSNSRNKSFEKGQGKNTENLKLLKAYLKQSEYIEKREQPNMCKQFNLPYIKSLFACEYKRRFYNNLLINTNTTADIFKHTGIPEKFICQAKLSYEKKVLLQVLFLDRYSAKRSVNVNFLTTNKALFKDSYKIK
jgi:hypothetical protein